MDSPCKHSAACLSHGDFKQFKNKTSYKTLLTVLCYDERHRLSDSDGVAAAAAAAAGRYSLQSQTMMTC